jgi:hypothetical protein
MTNKTKKDIEIEERLKRARLTYVTRKVTREMGREPMPGEIEKLMEERKGIKRSQNLVVEYYRFYQDKIVPDIPIIKDRIEKSKTNETKMYVEDFAKRTAMIGKYPSTILEKSRPALLIEGITVNLGDKGKFVVMKKATGEEKLTGQAKSLADRICRFDPQTDSPRVVEFQRKICQLIVD